MTTSVKENCFIFLSVLCSRIKKIALIYLYFCIASKFNQTPLIPSKLNFFFFYSKNKKDSFLGLRWLIKIANDS